MIEISVRKPLYSAGDELKLDVTINLEPGQIMALYGPSGVGKTSLLRMISGLMRPESGRICINGKVWFDSSTKQNLKPQERNAGFVFQDFALFPNLTVEGNLMYGLPKNSSRQMVYDLLERFELQKLKDRKPELLSGGQKQRVALARTLVQQPELLLLDEPLSALDPSMRRSLQDYIRQINSEQQCTIILVSHDISEIFRTAHKVLVLDNGKADRYGAPHDVFARKQISGKFRFTGEILGIRKEDVIYVAEVLIGTDIIKVVLDPSEITNLSVGDKVMVASKAFNPIIQKLS
ncbi:ATP-binding cassette domain-containing protein [Fulvivirga sedimenti]|uniref:ATP-binding cassette domain-containing protein n=1 Tax=Fulvivirga sedimenti TaxID=2879465 RepID=A0A9X1HMV1_9BACT|nr:ATP-binding cassette domain-containing protein [Fulvivirga sedimenti]MCA6073497.1 ATP-binding cassette domain-containing protein [Fulvivirga sedimenti]